MAGEAYADKLNDFNTDGIFGEGVPLPLLIRYAANRSDAAFEKEPVPSKFLSDRVGPCGTRTSILVSPEWLKSSVEVRLDVSSISAALNWSEPRSSVPRSAIKSGVIELRDWEGGFG